MSRKKLSNITTVSHPLHTQSIRSDPKIKRKGASLKVNLRLVFIFIQS